MHIPPEGANLFLYTLLVFIHIFATMVAVGLNASYVIWILRGSKETASLSFALRSIKFIDDYVANPCYLAGGVTGVLMILMGKAVAPFLWVVIGLYVLAMAIAYGVYTPCSAVKSKRWPPKARATRNINGWRSVPIRLAR